MILVHSQTVIRLLISRREELHRQFEIHWSTQVSLAFQCIVVWKMNVNLFTSSKQANSQSPSKQCWYAAAQCTVHNGDCPSVTEYLIWCFIFLITRQVDTCTAPRVAIYIHTEHVTQSKNRAKIHKQKTNTHPRHKSHILGVFPPFNKMTTFIYLNACAFLILFYAFAMASYINNRFFF